MNEKNDQEACLASLNGLKVDRIDVSLGQVNFNLVDETGSAVGVIVVEHRIDASTPSNTLTYDVSTGSGCLPSILLRAGLIVRAAYEEDTGLSLFFENGTTLRATSTNKQCELGMISISNKKGGGYAWAFF